MKFLSVTVALLLVLPLRPLTAGEDLEKLRELFHQGDYDQARLIIPAALEEATRPDSAEIYFYEASAERVAELAEIKMMEVTRKFPDSPYSERALLRAAIYHFEINNFARSEFLLRKILKDYLLTPIEPEIRLWLGRNYLARGEHRSARVELRHGINSLPDFPQTSPWIKGELYYWLGEVCERAGDLDCARESFHQVALLEGKDPLALVSMARLAAVLEQKGENNEADVWRSKHRTAVDGTMLEDVSFRSSPDRINSPVRQPAERPPEPDSGGDVWIQVGSFSSRANADNLRQVLEDSGVESEVVRVKLDGNNYYRVRVGPYGSRTGALTMLRRLGDMGIEGRVLQGD